MAGIFRHTGSFDRSNHEVFVWVCAQRYMNSLCAPSVEESILSYCEYNEIGPEAAEAIQRQYYRHLKELKDGIGLEEIPKSKKPRLKVSR